MFHIYGLYHIYLYIRSAFYVFPVRKGGGAVNFGSLFSFVMDSDGVMDLVYGSSSYSYMDCKVIFGDECFHIRRSGVRLDQCSCVGAFVIGLIIFGSDFYGSTTFRMSTRQLPVILFVSRFEYPFISCCLLHGVPIVAGGVFYFICV